MADIWNLNLKPADKEAVSALAERRRALGLSHTFADTIRGAVALAMTASDDELRRGEL